MLIFIFLVVTFISSNSIAAFIKTTVDPTSIGVGARPLGMGGCFVALADDIDSIYLNPAGLANLKSWQLTSMTTKLIGEIDYVSLAGSYNTDYGTFGIGYVGANMSGSFVTGFQLVDQDNGIIVPSASEEGISYTSSVILLSYGSAARRFLNFDFLDKVAVGATLKFLSQGLSGGDIGNGVLSGYNMDLGFLYAPLPYLSFGWNQIDCLSNNYLVNSSDLQENLMSTAKIGLAFKALGDENAYWSFPQPVTFLLDANVSPNPVPTTFSAGIEWKLSSYLSLRVGMDQDIVGSDQSTDEVNAYSIDSNLTAGIGLSYNGFKVDYAYHKFGSLTENDTYYLSLSYASQFETPKPEAPVQEGRKTYLTVLSPNDKTTTYDEAVTINGILDHISEITSLNVNGSDISFSPTGTFEATYPLSLGKNAFKIVAMHGTTVLASSEVRLLRLVSFKDVPERFWTKRSIKSLATLGIIGGYPDNTFRPNKSISRAELTTLLIKTRGVTTVEGEETGFADVKSAHWASFYIKSGVDLKLIQGYPDKTFRPSKALNRAEGVTIITRFAGLPEPDVILEGPFPDVPGRHWAAKSITAARSGNS